MEHLTLISGFTLRINNWADIEYLIAQVKFGVRGTEQDTRKWKT